MYNNVDESERHNVKQKNIKTKKNILYESCIRNPSSVYSCLLPEYDPSECDLFCKNPSLKSDFKESLCVIPSETTVCLRIFLLHLDKSSGQTHSGFKFILFFNVSKTLALSHPIPC